VGDPDVEAEVRGRRSRRWFALVCLVLVVALLASGWWVRSQAPAAVALQARSATVALPQSALDSRAALLADRLAVASGRSLQSLAAEVASPSAVPTTSEAPVVAGAEAAGEKYSDTLAQLSEAEAAAAEQLAVTEEQARAAEAEQKRAADQLASEEAAAAREVDAAIDAAIAAAQAQANYPVPLGGFVPGAAGGPMPTGPSTSTAEVLALVRDAFPADQVGNAMAISRCESGHANRVGQPNANGSRDFGIFQINDAGTIQAALRSIGVGYSSLDDARRKALDPALNVRMARAIWSARGWQPWVCAAKMQIVAGLYQRTPGPMAGRYDEYGRAI